MANKVRGQIAAEFQGERINLILSTNSICELEDAAGVAVDVFLERFTPPRKPSMRDLRLMFWAMMLDERPKATLSDAGALIDELRGDYERILAQAVLAAFPDPEEPGGDAAPGK